MPKSIKKEGVLFKKTAASTSSWDARLIYAITHLEKPTSYNLAIALGLNRKTIIDRIKILQYKFPEGYSMIIEKPYRAGYKITDYGVFNSRKIKQ